MSSLVPDSIEPVVGWKGWYADPTGRLASPRFPLVWELGKPARSRCNRPPRYYWDLVPYHETNFYGGQPPAELLPPPTGITAAIVFSVPKKPPLVEPDGYTWVMKSDRHHPPGPDSACCCGIHIAQDVNTALPYAGNVVGKIAGWGKVIEHAQGWRVQYAYPQELYTDQKKNAKYLQAYGVPVVYTKNLLSLSPYYNFLARMIAAMAFGSVLSIAALTAIRMMVS